jgi:hypothetical protein
MNFDDCFNLLIERQKHNYDHKCILSDVKSDSIESNGEHLSPIFLSSLNNLNDLELLNLLTSLQGERVQVVDY